VSEVAESQVAGGRLGGARHAQAAGDRRSTAIAVVIVVTTALALALRVYYQSTRAGFLLGVTEYDDGPYFGSALRLAAGVLPYRDFIIVQPPGITLLLTPVALVARMSSTATGMELARILTTAASGAGVVLAGLLVRCYGTLAVLITCGIMAVHPESIAAAHTVLVEPWLVLFCLIGALALFDGDQLARGWRLFWAGVAFGFGGAVEAWAIVPVVVAIGLFWPRLTRSWPFCAGVAAGFLVPVLPFAALAPRQFYDAVIVAQIERVSPARTPVWGRLANILGIFSPTPGEETAVLVIAIAVAAVVAALVAAAWLVTHRPPPLLERFVVLTSAVVIVMFCLADQYYYHFIAFLVPFLAASIALPASRLLTATRAPDGPVARRGVLWWLTAGLAAVAIVVVAVTQFQAESGHANVIGPAPHAIERIIPPGACVLTDQVSMTILADRFYSDVPGCSQMVDGLGTDEALSHGEKPSNGAGSVPAVAAVWRQAFSHAQFVLLSPNNVGRIAWTPSLKAYFGANFVQLKSPWRRVALYKRRGFNLQRAWAAVNHQ
jgi:alpha-1,2-mannosyltransferase